ncbi:MAG: glycosyltransferase [Desulfuromonadaceae bacterium]|nr:glycosyltransferase [Desulfuromonadaceae bacterium]
MPKCVVVLAAYRGQPWIGEQLDSILNQSGMAVRVVVSIDPSPDGTEDVVRHYAAQDSRVTLLPVAKRFGCAAGNFYHLLCEVDLGDVDCLAFADQDDLWCSDKLRRAWNRLDRGYDAYSSNVRAFWPDGRSCLIEKARPQRAYDYLFEAAGPGCTYVLSHRLAESLQQFARLHRQALDEVYFHDWFFYAYARSAGFNWYIDAEPGLLYRQHQHNQLGANIGLYCGLKRLAMMSSCRYGQQAMRISRLCLDRHPSCDDHQALIRIAAGGWTARWFVLTHVGSCRRARRDRLVLFICCLLGWF